MKLLDFDSQLKVRLAEIQNPRPFVCTGNPLECKVFIVGFNAATEMKAQFWNFWSKDYGFDKKVWFDTYVKERAEKPLKEGKTRRLKVSRTRSCIELITGALLPEQALETNLYITATTRANELKKESMDPSTFSFLLSTIKPKYLLVHGKEVKTYFENLTQSTLEQNRPNKVIIHGVQSIVYPVSHLSRGWSNERCKALGAELRDLIDTSEEA
ncbi:hypothetical protein ACRRS0_05390 [Agarivorans sp. QJM3NY_29]|uniref:hypothetical protein n=1 Tax=unclassified Agarivorans TaxID=2636026 RepID=UPI003D7DC86F